MTYEEFINEINKKVEEIADHYLEEKMNLEKLTIILKALEKAGECATRALADVHKELFEEAKKDPRFTAMLNHMSQSKHETLQ